MKYIFFIKYNQLKGIFPQFWLFILLDSDINNKFYKNK